MVDLCRWAEACAGLQRVHGPSDLTPEDAFARIMLLGALQERVFLLCKTDLEVLELSPRTFKNDKIVMPCSVSQPVLHEHSRLHVFSLDNNARVFRILLEITFHCCGRESKENDCHH